MRPIRAIRRRLGVTQGELAEALGVSTTNVCFYERGQTVPPARAALLIAYAVSRGLALSFDHIYGSAPLPELQPINQPAQAGAAQGITA
jgi:transcriptional regulator with XRE-family HTH domain